MTLTLQYVIDALNVGGLYALMALGIGLIFGIMRLINFAHGEMVMVGGYAMLLLIDLPGPVVVGVSILAVVALSGLGLRLGLVPLRPVLVVARVVVVRALRVAVVFGVVVVLRVLLVALGRVRDPRRHDRQGEREREVARHRHTESRLNA